MQGLDRKTNPKLVDITDSRAAQEAMGDRARLEEFFRRNFFNEDKTFRRAFRDFDSDADFRNLVEVQLRKLLNRRVFVEKRGAERSSDWRGSPLDSPVKGPVMPRSRAIGPTLGLITLCAARVRVYR